MASLLSTIARCEQFTVGPEKTLANGVLSRAYVTESSGTPVLASVPGVVKQFTKLNDDVWVLVLGPPDAGPSPVLRGLFHETVHVLADIPMKERVNVDKALLNTTAWAQLPTEFTDGLIFVSVKATTQLTKIEWSASPEIFRAYRQELHEIPATRERPPILQSGALVLATVRLRRDDRVSAPATGQDLLFDRTWVLDAERITRMYNTSANHWGLDLFSLDEV
ncbi:hypothetical protein B0H15DRAFT_796842 [Mycena belliarum]|uniref:Uncharacterized protein n=1 Tax=Mycena belliarum TaxID=1033014 RepID=A0AAD6XSJ7_9AGAR|nr:hypothetical protein B0H15DRAFT_796842 [Mycena belliae]